MRRIFRVLALIAALAASVAVIYGGRVLAFQHEHGKPAARPAKAVEPQTQMSGPEMVGNMQATAAANRKILYWYDPMHPAYKSDKPGIAPDCGMQLVPKYEGEDPPASMAPGTVMISAEKQQLIGVRTTTVQRGRLARTVRTTGQIVADETRIAHVHVKVNGFVDRVFVDFIGQLVKKGDPLFTLYSPDLVATQEEYLIARRGDRTLAKSDFKEVANASQSLLRAARDRLTLWDISDQQIEKLDQTGEISKYMTFYSPTTGFVLDRKAFPQTAVNPDTELYTVADLSHVWVTADVFEYEAPYVRVGQKAEMQLSFYPGRTWTGRIAYIYPSLDPQAHTLKVRIDVANPKFELKPQMFADVALQIDYGNQVVVPQEAVLNSGTQQTVFVALGDGHFEPRRIQTGAQVDGKVIVLSGLKPGETIVSSGNFLIDSESQLKSGMSDMQH